jgi:patatin-like phospholipase/acyl hydrolase
MHDGRPVAREPLSVSPVVGAKGFYTLGALKEIEGLTGGKLWERFDLVFGTSTGAIIAAL